MNHISNKMKKGLLTFLGSDSGFGKFNNSAYIETESKFILIDCGYTVFNILKEKFDFNKYKEIDIIITHLHNDHAGSLSQFVMYLWFVHKKRANIYSNCLKIKEYLNITGAPDISYNLIKENDNLIFIKTKHVKEIDTYGFLLKVGDKKIIYTSDTVTLEPYFSYLDNIDEFYVDISINSDVHLKIEEEMEHLKIIKNRGVNVYLMHIDNKPKVKEIIKDEFFIVQ